MKKSIIEVMREAHLKENPDCTYGDQPHFVPPGFGGIGFYLCMVPEDTINHLRCIPPFDHDHEDHLTDPY